MKTTKHNSASEAISSLKLDFNLLQITIEPIGQDGEFLWVAKTPFTVRDIQYCGSITFNHDANYNKVWYVKGRKV